MRATPEALRTLEEALRADAFTVATDYDGTLSPHVPDPTKAWAAPGAVAALQELAATDGTDAIVLTGRAKHEVVRFAAHDSNDFEPGTLRFRRPDGSSGVVYVLGHHGSDVDPEFGENFLQPLAEADAARRQRLEEQLLAALAERFPDVPVTSDLRPGAVDTVYLEGKEKSVGVHTRSFDHDDASRERAAQILAFVRQFHAENADGHDGPLYVTPGSHVEEIAVTPSSKGQGIAYIASKREGPIVFLGDDFTDLAGFEALRDGDVGVVVGPRLIEALRERGLLERGNLVFVDAPAEAVSLLGEVARCRAAQVRGEPWDMAGIEALRSRDIADSGPRAHPVSLPRNGSAGASQTGGARRPSSRRAGDPLGGEVSWNPTSSSSSPTDSRRTWTQRRGSTPRS